MEGEIWFPEIVRKEGDVSSGSDRDVNGERKVFRWYAFEDGVGVLIGALFLWLEGALLWGGGALLRRARSRLRLPCRHYDEVL